jgi:peroxiredoxin
MKQLVAVTVVTLIIVFIGSTYAKPIAVTNLSAGDSIKNYRLISPTGNVMESDSLTYPLLISVFTTWCKVCKTELKHLDEGYHQLKKDKKSFSIIAVDAGESQKSIRRYIRRRNLQLPVYVDTKLTFIKDLTILGTPTVLIFDKNKKLIFQGNDLPQKWKEMLIQ